MKWPENEQQVAIEVSDWLKSNGWTVYHEVICCNGRADIVAVQGSIVWAIEVKTSLTMKLLEQANDKLAHAHFTSIAVPYGKLSKIMKEFLTHKGIGCIYVRNPNTVSKRHYTNVEETVRPKLFRKTTGRIKRAIRTEYLDCVPGTSAPGWTPFKGTCTEAYNYVYKVGGSCLYRDMVKNIKHHYHTESGALSSFKTRIEEGLVPGLIIDRVDKKIWVRVKTNEKLLSTTR